MPIKILLLADTHLGFDFPIKPRVQKTRRGPDFFSNYLKALRPALQGNVNMVVHGGDMFFRSRVHPLVVSMAFEPLLKIADAGTPVFIAAGNHERSRIPVSLFEKHRNIFIFDRPDTFSLNINRIKIGMAGFPCIRENSREKFASMVEKTRWRKQNCDMYFLAVHQAFQGAQVGAQNFTFTSGADVITPNDIPSEFSAVLSGHIHRYQVLNEYFSELYRCPVFYPGATERTSFSERHETKGFIILTLDDTKSIKWEFFPLPTRPMVEISLLNKNFQSVVCEIENLRSNSIVKVKHGRDPEAYKLIQKIRSCMPENMILYSPFTHIHNNYT
ncbi:metallophosphoesterase [candidate division KSB1 bacterium]|nr:metallophosphoesterase [candidate division KSB1 bacterium]